MVRYLQLWLASLLAKKSTPPPSLLLRVVQYSQIDSIGVSGGSNSSIGESELFLCRRLIERGMSITIISAFQLGVKANLFCTNRAIGMTSFSFGTNPAIGTNGPTV